jgi:hypothetical protein
MQTQTNKLHDFNNSFNILLGLMPFLDNYAHLGGLSCGCVLGLAVLVQTRYYYSGVKKRKRMYQIVLMVISSFVLPAMFIAGYCVLFISGPVQCDWCVYVSCVPMPPNYPYAQRWWNCDSCSQGGLTGTPGPNNTLTFTCPGTTTVVTAQIPPTVTIDTAALVQACADHCL